MIKPEWGTKRVCRQCGARFYDMRRDPFHCPKCNAFAKEGKPSRPRRGALPPAAKPASALAAAPLDDMAKVVDVDDDIAASLNGESGEEENNALLEPVKGGEEDDGAIEDASDIGESDDDLSEVLEHVDDAIIDTP